MAAKRPEIMLWLSDARGQYIPRDFANSFSDRAKAVQGVSDEQWAILEAGPLDSMEAKENASEWYWDVWAEVCDSAIVTDNDGNKFHLYQDGDLWLVPDGMEWSDDTGFFIWPDDPDDDRMNEDGTLQDQPSQQQQSRALPNPFLEV